MLTLNRFKTALLKSKDKAISWTFDFNCKNEDLYKYYFSTKEITWGGIDYTAKVFDFNGIQLNRNRSEAGLIAPNKLDFKLTNLNNDIIPDYLIDSDVKTRLIVKGKFEHHIGNDSGGNAASSPYGNEEDDTNGWASNYDTLESTDADQTGDSSYSLHIQRSSTGTYADYNVCRLVAGRSYKIELDIKVVSGSPDIAFVEGAGHRATDYLEEAVTDASWTHKVYYVTCTATGDLGGIGIRDTSNFECYIDNVSIKETTPVVALGDEYVPAGRQMTDGNWDDVNSPEVNEQTTHDGQTNCRHVEDQTTEFDEIEISGDVNNNGEGSKVIGVETDGTIWSIYSDDTLNKIYVKSSTDEGATWSAATEIGDGDFPCCYMDSSDRLHMAWRDNANGIKYRRKNANDTLEATETVSATAAWNNNIDILVRSNGNIHIVWSDNANNRLQHSIYVSSWSTSEETSHQAIHQKMILDEDDNIHLVYREANGADNYIYYDKYTTSWVGRTQLNDALNTSSRFPDIVRDSNGRMTVFWTETGHGVNNTKRQMVYKIYDSYWNDVTALTDVANDVGGTCAEIEIDGTIIIAYHYTGADSGNPTVTNCVYQKYRNGSWSGEVLLSSESANVSKPCFHCFPTHPFRQYIVSLFADGAELDLRFSTGYNIGSAGCTSDAFTLTTDNLYFYSYQVKVITGTLRVVILDGDGETILLDTTYTDSSWTAKTGYVRSSSGGSGAKILFINNDENAIEFYIDEVFLFDVASELISWNFDVTDAVSNYQIIKVSCRDWLQKYLEGDYPNTPLVQDLFPSKDPQDNYCVPIIFGTAFIPVRSVYDTTKRYYILGPDSPTYTISKIKSPKEWPSKSVWESGSYTFTQSTITGSDGNDYKGVEFKIADSDNDGSADANGLFLSGEKFLDVPCKYSRNDTSSLVDPGDILEYVLEDFGIPSAKIDATSQATISATFAGMSLEFNFGLFYKEDRKKILARLLNMCQVDLLVRDKIYFHERSATSQKTITTSEVVNRTFDINSINNKNDKKDSGYITWQEADECLDSLIKCLIPVKSDTDNISEETVECHYIQDSELAQKAGILTLQRSLLADKNVKFRGSTTLIDLEVDDIITLNHQNYGDTSDNINNNMVVNGTMESDSNWSNYNAPEVNEISTEQVHGGSYSRKVVTDGSNAKGIQQSITGLTVGKVYRVSAWVYIKEGGPVKLFINGADQDTISTTGEWIHINEFFTYASGSTLFIYCANGVDAIFFADDVSIYPVEYDALIDSMNIGLDCSITFECIKFSDTLDEWGDLSPSAITPATDDSTSAYQVVTCGPDTTGITGATVPNSLKGRLRVGDDANYILLEPNKSGDRFIASGKSDFETANNGFIIGIDHSDSDKVKFYLGDASNYCYWDGSNLVIIGNITATTGTIGGWTIGATTLSSGGANITLDSGNKKIYINNATYSNKGIQLDYNAGTPRAYIGDGANAYLNFDGTKLTWKGTNSELDASGNIICSGGTIGGFTLSSTTLSAGTTNIILDASNKAISINDATWQNAGIQLQYNGGTPRFYCGNGVAKFFQFDGTNVLTSDGEIKACTLTDALLLGDGATINGTITFNHTDTLGDTYIACGKSDFTNVDDGFILGVDDSDGDTAKFYVGNDTDYFNWDGSNIILACSASAAITILGGGGIVLDGDDAAPGTITFVGSVNTNTMGCFSSAGQDFSLYPSVDDGGVYFAIGKSDKRFYDIRIYSTYYTSIWCGGHDEAENAVALNLGIDAGLSYIDVFVSYASSGDKCTFYEDEYDCFFAPTVGDEWSLGTSDYYWAEAYIETLHVSNYIFMNETSNANMTIGLTINQGANDNEILSFKSSDIAHALVGYTETDTYGYFKKLTADNGGLYVTGINDSGAYALYLRGIAESPDSNTDTSAIGCVTVVGLEHDGAGSASALYSDDNIFVAKDNTNTRFIVKADGDIYYDGADQGAYDVYEDALACSDLSANLSNQFSKVLKYNKEKFNEMGVIAYTKHDDGKEDIFVSTKGMTMLQLGAIAELYRVCNVLCDKLGITYNEAKLLK